MVEVGVSSLGWYSKWYMPRRPLPPRVQLCSLRPSGGILFFITLGAKQTDYSCETSYDLISTILISAKYLNQANSMLGLGSLFMSKLTSNLIVQLNII